MPAVKLFYVENNLHDDDLFILHAWYSLVIFLTEIPSGYLADIFGRKRTMLIGLLCGIAGFFTYSLSYGFTGFLLAEIALGIGHGFISGADSALLYDSLLEEKKEDQYLRQEGRISSAGNLAEAVAGISFTLMAFAAMRPYYQIQTLITFLGFIAACFLIEPTVHGQYKKISLRDILETVRTTLWKNPQLSRYVLFSSIIGFASLSMAWFAQIFLYEAGVKQANFGLYWTLLNIMVALGSISAISIDKRLGARISLFYILLFLSAGFFISSHFISMYGIALLLIFYFVRGSAHPILKDKINRLSESRVRATVLSVRSLVIRIMFAGLAPMLGWFTEKISLESALILCGTIVFIPGLILVVLIMKKGILERN
jgi:MFS family permease